MLVPLSPQIYSVTQAGVMSSRPVTFSWHVLLSAPSVRVLSRPDAVSGSAVAAFTLSTDWGTQAVTRGMAAESASVTYQALLLSDNTLGSFHTPPSCADVVVGVGTSHRDCLQCDNTTDATCVYYVALSRTIVPPLTQSLQSFTLQVHAVLFDTAGQVTTLQWQYLRCSQTEYGVVSGNDTLRCEEWYVPTRRVVHWCVVFCFRGVAPGPERWLSDAAWCFRAT